LILRSFIQYCMWKNPSPWNYAPVQTKGILLGVRCQSKVTTRNFVLLDSLIGLFCQRHLITYFSRELTALHCSVVLAVCIVCLSFSSMSLLMKWKVNEGASCWVLMQKKCFVKLGKFVRLLSRYIIIDECFAINLDERVVSINLGNHSKFNRVKLPNWLKCFKY